MHSTKKTVTELKKECREKGIKGYSLKTKKELVNLLYGAEPKTEPKTPETAQDTDTPDIPSEKEIECLLENNIFLEDCLVGMKRIKNNSIDLVCTDPPYFLDNLDDKWNKESIVKKGASSMVGNLPKGMKFDRNQSKLFYEFMMKVATEIFRILKPGGAFISFSSPRLYHSMTYAIESVGFEIRDMLGWIYVQSQVKAFSQNHIIENDKTRTDEEKNKLKLLCENWKTPQLRPGIEPMCLAVKPIEGRYIDNFEQYGTGLLNTAEDTKVGVSRDRFPSNIMTTDCIYSEIDNVFLVPKPTREEKRDYNTHLSVKPIQLVEHLIRLFTKENAVVLDPFMGSGTTAIACINSDRKYIGFEINQEYINIAKRRIDEL